MQSHLTLKEVQKYVNFVVEKLESSLGAGGTTRSDGIGSYLMVSPICNKRIEENVTIVETRINLTEDVKQIVMDIGSELMEMMKQDAVMITFSPHVETIFLKKKKQ